VSRKNRTGIHDRHDAIASSTNATTPAPTPTEEFDKKIESNSAAAKGDQPRRPSSRIGQLWISTVELVGLTARREEGALIDLS
jgi:hypothetical protein